MGHDQVTDFLRTYKTNTRNILIFDWIKYAPYSSLHGKKRFHTNLCTLLYERNDEEMTECFQNEEDVPLNDLIPESFYLEVQLN